MQEIWKPVVGFEDYYLVSNTGKVFSIRAKRELHCKPKHTGYHAVELNVDKHVYYKRTHRLVAEAFISNPNPEKFDQVNHIDGNKLNNNADNLEWCDASHNMKHAHETGLEVNWPNTYHVFHSSVADVYIFTLEEAAKRANCCVNTLLERKKDGRPMMFGPFKGWTITTEIVK